MKFFGKLSGLATLFECASSHEQWHVNSKNNMFHIFTAGNG